MRSGLQFLLRGKRALHNVLPLLFQREEESVVAKERSSHGHKHCIAPGIHISLKMKPTNDGA